MTRAEICVWSQTHVCLEILCHHKGANECVWLLHYSFSTDDAQLITENVQEIQYVVTMIRLLKSQ